MSPPLRLLGPSPQQLDRCSSVNHSDFALFDPFLARALPRCDVASFRRTRQPDRSGRSVARSNPKLGLPVYVLTSSRIPVWFVNETGRHRQFDALAVKLRENAEGDDRPPCHKAKTDARRTERLFSASSAVSVYTKERGDDRVM